MGKGAISCELAKFCESGLLLPSKQGAQINYPANKAFPILNELASIVEKTFGLVGVLQMALAPLLPKLEQTFFYGSIFKRIDHADSDVDVMLAGE
jgi:hypothetical protein